MNTTINNDFTNIVTERRSIRTYDPTVKITREEMSEILTEATLAPSSTNMQPWRFIVIDSPEGKATLAPLARFNQSQVETSAAVIAVLGDMNNFDNAEEIYGRAVELGYMTQEVKEKQMAALTNYYNALSPENMKDTVLIDGGLVSMQLMLVARAHGYDTNAIGGFEKDKLVEAFGLDKERYIPVMLISIGKAAVTGYKSVRLPVNKVSFWK
ncbi:nitroreductase family protein [Paenibacillus oenotherae]|uniref:Nitroreductase family protein n=1 Tax=Paenibacillus oenotherae TaxID=1435645 RepID=A0ABS7D003_9BACL|nr:nitroreductase family protein [Paenibacillus oenotherae]MBW7473139.1 nitroreductase family protein [Paenibacillus oenotherae]